MRDSITTIDDAVVIEDAISLKQFPPKLRKLGKHLLESDKPMTVSQACRELNINRESIGTMIHRAKQNGNDFKAFVDEQSKMILHVGKIGVYKALQEGAVSDSHQDRKLYFQLTGDLKEEANITVNNLTIGINIEGTKPSDTRKPKTVLDINPIIPDKD